MFERFWSACRRWASRRENAAWLAVFYSAVMLGIFCCATDQPSGPLGDVASRLLAAVMTSWLGVAHPELSRWIVDGCARSAAITVIRLLRRLGLL